MCETKNPFPFLFKPKSFSGQMTTFSPRIWRILPLCLMFGGCAAMNKANVIKLDYDPAIHSHTSCDAGVVQVKVVDGIIPRPITTSLPQRYMAKVKTTRSSSPHYTADAFLFICSYQGGSDHYFTNGSLLTLCVDAGGNLKGIAPSRSKGVDPNY